MSEPSEALLRLVPAASLLDIHFFEISARRAEEAPPGEAEEAAAGSEDAVAGEDVEPTYGLRVDIDPEAMRFRLRLRIELAPKVGPVIAEAAAEYQAAGFATEDLDQNLLIEYANQVGVMALLPYLRQAIADITQRVFGAPLLMPILERGAVSFSLGSEDAPAGA